MKRKDVLASTTLRSVLSEFQAAEKKSGSGPLNMSQMTSITRKAVLRRQEAAAQYLNASRIDLALKEQDEATLLSEFLPPLLSTPEIDLLLHEAIAETDAKNPKDLGKVSKAFYSKVDKCTVDTNLVKTRAGVLLSSPIS